MLVGSRSVRSRGGPEGAPPRAGWRWPLLGTGVLLLSGAVLALGYLGERAARRRAEAALAGRLRSGGPRPDTSLDEQLRFEALLAEQSAAFSRVSAASLDREIEQGLRRIADYLQADQGSLTEFSPAGRAARVTHEWVTEGGERPPSTLAPEERPWVLARLLAGEVVRFSRLEDLPEDGAPVDRRSYARLGITARIEVPLVVEGAVMGALAFGTLARQRAWRDDLVQRLRLLGEVFASILSRRRADLEVQRLRRDLAHVARVSTMGELTASLAHELGQPLTAILSNAEAAERILGAEGADCEEVRAILRDIVADDKRAAAVISRLRGLLRRGVLELSALDLNELMAEVARLVASDAIVRNVTIRLEPAPELPPVRGDRVQLQQVLLNLILNGLDAIRASGTGGGALTLRTAREGPGAVRIAVCDSGVGIDQADLDHIFDAFYTTKAQGIGMGLAIARSIVEAHGGRLTAENNPDGGATVSFTLPAGEAGP